MQVKSTNIFIAGRLSEMWWHPLIAGEFTYMFCKVVSKEINLK